MHRKLSLLQDPFELTTSSLSGHLLTRKLGKYILKLLATEYGDSNALQ